jgi:hypothetical protein
MGDFRTGTWPKSRNQELRDQQSQVDAAAAEVQDALHNLEPAYRKVGAAVAPPSQCNSRGSALRQLSRSGELGTATRRMTGLYPRQ